MNYLDETGLSYFWEKIKQHVTSSIDDAVSEVGSYTINGYEINTNPVLDKADIGLSNVTNDAQVKRSEMGVAGGVATLSDSGQIPASQLPSYVDDVLDVYNGLKLGSSVQNSTCTTANAIVYYNMDTKTFVAQVTSDSSRTYYAKWKGLTSFPDSTMYGTETATGATPAAGKIYVYANTNKTYRWSGSDLVEISKSLALGETSSTAYAGDKGKANRDAINSLPSTLISSVSRGTVGANTITINVNKATKSGLNYGSPSAANFDLPAATTTAAGLMTASSYDTLQQLGNIAETGILKPGINVSGNAEDFVELIFPYTIDLGDGWDNMDKSVVIPAANSSEAGVMTSEMYNKLNEIGSISNQTIDTICV